jgi:hypothetical protein
MKFVRRVCLATFAFACVPFAAACEFGDASGNTVAPDAAVGATGVTDAGALGSADADASASKPSDASPMNDARGDANASSNVDPTDALVTSFVFVGCNRVQKSDWDSVANPSSANLAQLDQTFTDVAALPNRPRFFFFTGDMVLGMKSGTSDLSTQLSAWASEWKSGPLASSVALVPMPGNHEMLYKDKTSGLELANEGAGAFFSQWLEMSGFATHAGNGPTSAAPNSDALEDDQSKLSYSFDDGSVHYVVLNTDTWTTTMDSTTQANAIGWIALSWLGADLKAAQANAAISSIFVFGHKPIVAPTGVTDSSEAINPTLVSALETLIDGTPKVKAYFTAHAHLWDARKIPGARGVMQVIAGNGGSALDLGGNFYGFTEARVYASGKLGVVSWQRPVPNPYMSTQTTKAAPAAELVLQY